MPEVTNRRMFEVLKQIQGDVRVVRSTRLEERTEFGAPGGHFIAMQADIANICSRLGQVEERLDRVEKRLGLVDVELN